MAGTLLRQAFHKDLVKTLFPANEFYNYSKNDTQFVNDTVVNLPHVGTEPTVAEDRTDKGTATKRADVATKYSMHELSTDPTWLAYSEELVVNYDKRASIIEEHSDALNTGVADRALYYWALGGDDARSTKPTIVRTTGTARVAGTPSATGNRKGLAYADVLAVITKLNKQDVPQEGRYGVITADMLADLLNVAEFKSSDYNKTQPAVDAPQSFRWLGITWFVRSRVNVFDNESTPGIKAVGAAGAEADNAGAIVWHKDFVRFAKGTAKVFLNLDDAELYGSKMSALVRYGATGARKDCKGVINIVETATT